MLLLQKASTLASGMWRSWSGALLHLLGRLWLMQAPTGLCSRRSWPEPQYEYRQTRTGGYVGVARVNNREYISETEADTPRMAMERAASQAYVICRNFSLNNGMYPDQRTSDAGLVQGLPAAIGSGRRVGRRVEGYPEPSQMFDSRSTASDGSSGSSDMRSDYSSSPTRNGRCRCGQPVLKASDQCAFCFHTRSRQMGRQH